MADIVTIIVVLTVWFVLQTRLLPRLGVPT
jgi:hypothetical protein